MMTSLWPENTKLLLKLTKNVLSLTSDSTLFGVFFIKIKREREKKKLAVIELFSRNFCLSGPRGGGGAYNDENDP
jgi:hypothetical protein